MLGTLLNKSGHTFGIRQGVEHLGCSSTSLGYRVSGITFWSAQISKQRAGTIYGMHINKHRSETHNSGKHIWNKSLEHTSGAHLSPVCSMSLPRKNGCCLAWSTSLASTQWKRSPAIGHAIPARGPGRPPSRRAHASGLPFPPFLACSCPAVANSRISALCSASPMASTRKSWHMGS